MKRSIIHIITFVLSILILVSCEDRCDRFSLEGRIRNTDMQRVHVIYMGSDNIIHTDTVALSEKGHFKISGKIDSTAVAILYLNRRQWTSVFVRKGDNVYIIADANCMDLAQVRGGRLNDELSSYKKSIKNLLLEKSKIIAAVTESYRNKNEKTGITVSEALDPKLANINHSLVLSAENYIKKNPESLVGTILMLDFLCREENPEKLDKMSEMLKEPAKSFYLVDFLNNISENMKNVEIGKQAPGFTLQDSIGNNISLSDFKGKYLLLNFRISTDSFSGINNRYDPADIYNKYKDNKNFSILGVFIDGSKISWIEVLKQDAIPWSNTCDLQGLNSDIVKLYGIVFASKNFLINPEGVIIAGDVKLSDIESIIPN